MGIVHAIRRRLSVPSARVVLALGLFGIAGAALGYEGYTGNSYLQIPGIKGGWKGTEYTESIRIVAHYWRPKNEIVPYRAFGGRELDGPTYSAPTVPRNEHGAVVIALKKESPDLATLMKLCKQGTTIKEAVYAESSERARHTASELGSERPPSIPEYYEYRLKNIQFSECPVVTKAPEQALVLTFSDIEWLNFKGDAKLVALELKPARLPPKQQTSGKKKQYVVSWFGPAHDVGNDQCPVMNDKPPQELYFKYLPKEEAARVRAELAKAEAGVDYQSGEMGLRGPNKLDVTRLPGIVEDPGHAEPQTRVARGLNLDGYDGSGAPPAGVCKHENFVSEDGRKGIDNQMYRVMGCIPGWQGHNGFIVQFVNNQMRDGLFTMLIEVSGIDNEQNDDSVDITWLYSKDPMTKDAAGQRILHDNSFRPADEPEYTHYFSRTRGRVVDGVILSDVIDTFKVHIPRYDTPAERRFRDARIRLEPQPDGTLKGVVGGYQDWKRFASIYSSSITESYFGYQMPGLYNAFLRNADGMKDPVTGECNGISAAYDIEAVPAFIVDPEKQLAKMEMK